MIGQEQVRWQPLGSGRIAPQGSIADRALADRLATYKRQVAGRYRSISPADLAKALPPGPYILSPKLDGETWFLHASEDEVCLLSPTGRLITDVPVTGEATHLLASRVHTTGSGLLWFSTLPFFGQRCATVEARGVRIGEKPLAPPAVPLENP